MYMRSMLQKWIPQLTDYLEDKKEEIGDGLYLHTYKCLKEDYDFIQKTQHIEEGFKKYKDFVDDFFRDLSFKRHEPLNFYSDKFLNDTEKRLIRLEQLKKTIDIVLDPDYDATLKVEDNEVKVTYRPKSGGIELL